MKNYFILLIVLISVQSCKTISINKEFQQKTTHSKQLGSIGEHNNFVLDQDYNPVALPNYEAPIRLKASTIPFNPKQFKTFIKAKAVQSSSVNVTYVDSISEKPTFLKLEIVDRVTVLEALKNEQNNAVLDFMTTNPKAELITSISIAFDKTTQETISNAEEIFLEPTGLKSYALTLYKGEKLQQRISFKEGVVFAYQSSNFCWKQNSKYQVELVDIVETNDKCPRHTYPSAKRAKKRINYYKF